MKKSFTLLLTLCVLSAGSGCSMFSKSARQERAYDRYVEKSSRARLKQRALFKHSAPAMPSVQDPSDFVASADAGPTSVSASEE